MVLVSNEWQNKSEDEQKSSASNVATSTTTTAAAATGAIPAPITDAASTGATTTTTAVAITSTISPATATVVNADLSCCPVSATDGGGGTIAAADNQNCEPPPTAIATTKTTAINAHINRCNNGNELLALLGKITAVGFNNNELNDKNDDDDDDDETKDSSDPRLTTNRNLKIMAENAKETTTKEEEEAVQEKNTGENNSSGIESTLIISGQDLVGETVIKDSNETDSNSPDSNTNTLLPSVTVKTQSIQNAKTTQEQQPQPKPLSSHKQAITNALKSALYATTSTTNVGNNSTTTTTTTAAAGLQPNYLSQLALVENIGELKAINVHTLDVGTEWEKAREQNRSSVESTLAKNDCNLALEANASSLPTGHPSSLASTTVPSSDNTNNGQAKILLICEGNSHPFQARTIHLTPNVECMVGRLIAKSKAAENNAIFDCKVLSRKHAVIWYTPDGKFWVKDTKSSNGTFINDNKLDDKEAELHFGDIVKFGVDVVENSRKEVHGCIIACVKLYLPDGREAISIDSPAHRSQYSGKGRISYDDLHRLNLYIQETSQREKVLASKLCSIQNVLEATRKNSASCWQSMITEDQLLHRIHSLEKKLSFMEKNVPENVLRNEVLKLLDDKNSYQHTAKEALRRVYQDRCDAMQMLAKMESAYSQSDSECALLRDQIMNSKQTLQDVNTRLLHLETEYNEYRDDVARQQQEAKEREEQRIVELTEKLRERELECEELKKKISELLLKRADLLEDEEQMLQKQAIEKLDAAIADMDLGEDDEDDDEDDEDDENDSGGGDVKEEKDVDCENKRNGNAADTSSEAKNANDASSTSTESSKQTNLSTKVPTTLTSIFGDNINGTEIADNAASTKKSQKKAASMLASLDPTKKKPKRVRESTIMKWLNNSDLKKNEGSLDIFKAICNENEDGDDDAEAGASSADEDIVKFATDQEETANEFIQKTDYFTSILRNFEQNLKQLEAEIDNQTTGNDGKTTMCSYDKPKSVGSQDEKKERSHKDVYDFDENSDDEDDKGAHAEDDEGREFIVQRNGGEVATAAAIASSHKVLSKNNKNYQLLKTNVNMLREIFNDIRDTVKDQQEAIQQHGKDKLNQQLLLSRDTMSRNAANSPIETPDSSRVSCDDIDLDTDSISEVESLSQNSPVYSTHSTIKQQQLTTNSANTTTTTTTPTSNHLLEEQLKDYQDQVGKLNEKLQQTELEAQHTLEIMQVECDDVKLKMSSLKRVIESLKEDKKALEKVINENKHNKSRIQQENETTESVTKSSNNAVLYKELIDAATTNRVDEDILENDLADINVTAMEREEELITYKERLDEQQKENIELRNEIATLKLKATGGATAVYVGGSNTDVLLKRVLPYGFVVLAIVVYFITTYF